MQETRVTQNSKKMSKNLWKKGNILYDSDDGIVIVVIDNKKAVVITDNDESYSHIGDLILEEDSMETDYVLFYGDIKIVEVQEEQS